jgi:hypothetical protein
MARAVISAEPTGAAFEPIYDVCPHTGDSLEVFFADNWLAKSFGRRAGWFWWTCQSGCLPEGEPSGPFATSYAAYRNFALAKG